MTQSGTVYVVGAEPGSLDYLTVRGRDLLQRAECLVYDALVDEALLELLPAGCDRINMGKRGGQPSPPQVEISQLLVKLSLEGRSVVRLKSVDPFIFRPHSRRSPLSSPARTPIQRPGCLIQNVRPIVPTLQRGDAQA